MPFLETEKGIDIYYDYEPIKNKSTIVFLHGISLDHTMWNSIISNFKGRYGILTLDLRGHGQSSMPSRVGCFNLEHFVNDLALVIKHLKLKDFYLVGFSLGGMIATEYASKPKPTGILLVSTPISYFDINKLFILSVKAASFVPQSLFKLIDSNTDFSEKIGNLELYIKCLARTKASICSTIIRSLRDIGLLRKLNGNVIIITSKNDGIIKNKIKSVYSDYCEVNGGHYAPIMNNRILLRKLIELVGKKQTGKA